jgi:hypothetical protein
MQCRQHCFVAVAVWLRANRENSLEVGIKEIRAYQYNTDLKRHLIASRQSDISSAMFRSRSGRISGASR